MAEELSISELTVYKHRTNMIKKANVTNAGSLFNYAVKNEFLQSSEIGFLDNFISSSSASGY